MTATTTAPTSVNEELTQQAESAPFKLQKKGDALLKPGADWGEDPAYEVRNELAGPVVASVAPATAKRSANFMTLREIEENRVIWAIAQSEALYSLYAKVDDSESSFDKEWKANLKWETDGDITPAQAEKLINIAQVLKDNPVEAPEKRFSVSGLTEWSRVPGSEIRDRILELALADDAEFGETLLTAKRVKSYHGIALAETSEAVPDAVRDEVNALSGSAKLKARKELVTYVKEASKIESEEVVQSLRTSTERKAQKGEDILTLLKDVVQDAKAVYTISDSIEFIPEGKVEALVSEVLSKDLAAETNKALKSARKRAKFATSLPGAIEETLKICDELYVGSTAETPNLRLLVADLTDNAESSDGQKGMFIPISEDTGWQVSLKKISHSPARAIAA